MYICVDRTDNLTILNLHFIAQSAESPLQGRNVQNIICHSFIFWPRVATSIFSDFKQSWDEEVQSKLFIKTFEKQMAPKLNIKNILYNINSVLFILPEKGNWYTTLLQGILMPRRPVCCPVCSLSPVSAVTMNTVQSVGHSGHRKGMARDRSTLDLLEVSTLHVYYQMFYIVKWWPQQTTMRQEPFTVDCDWINRDIYWIHYYSFHIY